MASRRIVQATAQGQVKPVLSLNRSEAHRRVMNLYRAWYRQIPYIAHRNPDLPVTEKKMFDKLRELFYKNSDVTDVRVIDILVIKGQMELNETVLRHKQHCHIMNWFKETHPAKPKDFMSKFLAGKDSE
jgi:NADH dehydrogenase (ubiquinone) 1 alpha subcomplex subunit 6